jgi:hypothetical protein
MRETYEQPQEIRVYAKGTRVEFASYNVDRSTDILFSFLGLIYMLISSLISWPWTEATSLVGHSSIDPAEWHSWPCSGCACTCCQQFNWACILCPYEYSCGPILHNSLL